MTTTAAELNVKIKLTDSLTAELEKVKAKTQEVAGKMQGSFSSVGKFVTDLRSKFSDMFSNIKKGLEETRKKFNDLGKNIEYVGRKISLIGTSLSFLGAAITGPLILAVNSASKESVKLSNSLEAITSASKDFSNTIGNALYPILNSFSIV
jgi:methyl-accepting chemotaxis protein